VLLGSLVSVVLFADLFVALLAFLTARVCAGCGS
jgi:hypothetical protein